jgi:hypothetical protein
MRKKDGFTHTYQKNSGRQALERAFLDRGSTPLRLSEDFPTTAVLAAAAIGEVAGTYEIPKVGSVLLMGQNAHPLLCCQKLLA